MKKVLIALSLVTIGLITQATSCEKPANAPGECGDIACTMMFAMVKVQVTDLQGNKVVLDEYYTLRENNGTKLSFSSSASDTGMYTVIDDSFISTLTNKSELFRFVGKKNGVEVVNERYEIQGDCCHVDKRTGKTTIVIP